MGGHPGGLEGGAAVAGQGGSGGVHPSQDADRPAQVEAADVAVRVVVLGKEPGGPQHDAGQSLIPVEQVTEVLGRDLRHAVDVLGNRGDVFGHPRGGSPGRWREGITKDARRAREDECPHPGRDRFLEEIERAGHVGVDELLPAVGGQVRLVQGGGVEDRLHAAHRAPNAIAVGYRPDLSRVIRGQEIERDDLAPSKATAVEDGEEGGDGDVTDW